MGGFCICVSLPTECLLPREARKQCCIPRGCKWLRISMSVLAIKARSFGKGGSALNCWANSPTPNFQFPYNNSYMSLKTIQIVCIIQWIVNTMNCKWKATTEFTLQKCQLAKFDDDIVEFLLGNNFVIVII